MKKLLLLLFIFTVTSVHAQCGAWEWAHAAASDSSDIGEGLAVCTDPAGNVIITGEYLSTSGPASITFGSYTFTSTYPSGVPKAYIVKYDPAGNVLWAKSPSGSAIGWSVSCDA